VRALRRRLGQREDIDPSIIRWDRLEGVS